MSTCWKCGGYQGKLSVCRGCFDEAKADSSRAPELLRLLERASDLLFVARGAALKLRATGCNHAEGCELVREYDTIMAWTKDAHAALSGEPSGEGMR